MPTLAFKADLQNNAHKDLNQTSKQEIKSPTGCVRSSGLKPDLNSAPACCRALSDLSPDLFESSAFSGAVFQTANSFILIGFY